MFPATPTQLTNFLIQANPAIAPLFQQDVVRGKAVLLKMLAELFVRKGAPLPPALTGYPTPSWNPVTSQFRFELGADKGVLKIAGQDVELFRIWHVLYTNGLYSKVCISHYRSNARYRHLMGWPFSQWKRCLTKFSPSIYVS
jgi:hypothetical protein